MDFYFTDVFRDKVPSGGTNNKLCLGLARNNNKGLAVLSIKADTGFIVNSYLQKQHTRILSIRPPQQTTEVREFTNITNITEFRTQNLTIRHSSHDF